MTSPSQLRADAAALRAGRLTLDGGPLTYRDRAALADDWDADATALEHRADPRYDPTSGLIFTGPMPGSYAARAGRTNVRPDPAADFVAAGRAEHIRRFEAEWGTPAPNRDRLLILMPLPPRLAGLLDRMPKPIARNR